MEIWKQVAINDLCRFNYLRNSIESMRQQIENINARLVGSGYCMGNTPVQGGGSQIEDKYNNGIVLKDKLENQIKQNEKDYMLIKSAFEKLSKDEQKILNYAYINRSHKYIEIISETFNVETAQAYRYVNAALQKYIMVRYGV